MNKNTIIILSIAGIFVLLLVAGIIHLKKFLPEYWWIPTYNNKEAEQPYATKFLYDMVAGEYSEENFIDINDNLSRTFDENDRDALYLFIGHTAYYDSLGMISLMEFAERGNRVFIACEKIPEQLQSEITFAFEELDEFKIHNDSIIKLSFEKDTLLNFEFHFQVYKKKQEYQWKYFEKDQLLEYDATEKIKIVSEIVDDKPNFIEYQHGRGAIYIYSTPLLLTNYHVLTEQGLKHVNTIFSEFSDIDKIYWDEFSKMPVSDQGEMAINNPLEFIMSQRSLRWAWYTIIALVLIYLIFGTKRKQKPVLILPENKNTSIEYAKAVGTLHFQARKHGKLAEDLFKLFLAFVKSRYGLSPTIEEDQLIELIAQKSEIPARRISEIFKQQIRLRFNPAIERMDIIDFNNKLEYFYTKCK